MESYQQRAQLAKHPLTQNLLRLMAEKRSNLSVAVDVTHANDLLTLADQVGPFICVLKTHVDILEDFSWSFVQRLTALAKKHRFLIFEDRKFADIGNTVKLQYEKGIYRIAEWADLVNAHSVPGPGIIDGLKQSGLPKQRGLLLLAEMSSQGSLATGGYTEATVEMAKKHRDFVIGFVAQHRLLDDPAFLYFTPGIQLEDKGDALGQQYTTPQQAIMQQGTDIIIVGRGIYKAKNPAEIAEQYRAAGWDAYQAMVK